VRRFSALFRELDGTTSTNQKIQALERYFLEEKAENSAWAVYLLLGKQRRRIITSRSLRGIFMATTSLPQWLVLECQTHVGDTAETVALLLNAESPRSTGGARHPLHQWLSRRIPSLQKLDEDGKAVMARRWWSELEQDQRFILNKILTGGFRVGVSKKLVVRALAGAFEVPEAVLAHRLMGEWDPTAEFFTGLVSQNQEQLPPSTPYPFFLASPLDDPRVLGDDLARWQAEWKWDGIRAQVIRREGGLYIWSRGEDIITDQFPDLADDLNRFPDGCVVDGEIVAWSAGRPLPFNHLQKRLGRKGVPKQKQKETPVHLIAYDLLEEEYRDIRARTLSERQELLAALLEYRNLERVHLSTTLGFSSWEELESLRLQARPHGVEGLMIKNRFSS
jgi:DNA ligase-1